MFSSNCLSGDSFKLTRTIINFYVFFLLFVVIFFKPFSALIFFCHWSPDRGEFREVVSGNLSLVSFVTFFHVTNAVFQFVFVKREHYLTDLKIRCANISSVQNRCHRPATYVKEVIFNNMFHIIYYIKQKVLT